MGKGRRAREVRAENREANPELFLRNNTKKNKKEIPWITVTFCAVLVFVVAIVGWNIIKSTGIIGRNTVTVKSDNFEVSANELSVYEFQARNYYSNELYTEYLYYQYGMATDTYGVTKTYSSADAYVNAMISVYKSNGILRDQAYVYAREFLAFCEGALKADYSVDDADIIADVNEYMDTLKSNAKGSNVSFGNYVSNMIGTGVSKADIRKAMQKYYLATKYTEVLNGQFSDAVTDEELNKYLEENKSQFYTSKYDSYKLKDEDMKKYFEALADDKKPSSAEDIKNIICDYMLDTMFEELYTDKFTDENIADENKDTTKKNILETLKVLNDLDGDYEEHFTKDKTGDYNKAAYEIVTAVNKELSTQLKNVTADSTASYSDPEASSATDLVKWLFGSECKTGENKIIETSTKSGSETVKTYTLYVAGRLMVLDTERTKNAGYILLKDDSDSAADAKTGEEKASAMFEELLTDPTSENFEALVEKYSAGSTALYDHISKSSISNEELADWLYDEARKENDTTTIKTDKGHYVAIYLGENEMTWRVNARKAIATERLEEWYENALEEYHVEALTKADDTTAATEAPTTLTTTPAGTTASTEAATSQSTENGTEKTTEVITAAHEETSAEETTSAE